MKEIKPLVSVKLRDSFKSRMWDPKEKKGPDERNLNSRF